MTVSPGFTTSPSLSRRFSMRVSVGAGVLGGLLTLLIFIGEAVRDAFDPRKQA